MKKIIRYQDNNGNEWDTEEEALFSDSKIILEESLNACSVDKDDFNISVWIDLTRKDPQVIKALIHVLDIDDTKMAVDRIMEAHKRES